jgi:hypothetical protein
MIKHEIMRFAASVSLRRAAILEADMARAKAPVRGTYQHYKGAFYEVLGVAEDPESGRKWVVYESLGITENLLEGKEQEEVQYDYRVLKNATKGALAVCTIERFTEEVDGGDYWDGRRVPRFRLVSPMPRD